MTTIISLNNMTKEEINELRRRKCYFNIEGEEIWLPGWYIDRTDEECREAAESIYEHIKNPPAKVEVEDTLERIEPEKLYDMLKADGFTSSEIETIFVRYYAGDTIDGAIQYLYI